MKIKAQTVLVLLLLSLFSTVVISQAYAENNTANGNLKAVDKANYPTVERLAAGSKEALTNQKERISKRIPLEVENGIGMRFRLVPAGYFNMGTPTTEKGRKNDETQHRVTLTKAFYLGVREVTQLQWKKVMGKDWDANRMQPSAIMLSTGGQLRTNGDDLPIIRVSWDDCQDFLKKLCQMEGVPEGTYRLPTEAEWEYACRAGTEAAFYAGEVTSPEGQDPILDTIGWYSDSQNGDPLQPTGRKQPNAWGLYDMSGGVSEWVQDACTYDRSVGIITSTYQDNVKDPISEKGDGGRVIRGGSWSNYARQCRCGSRNGGNQTTVYNSTGLRVVVQPRFLSEKIQPK